MRIRWLAVVVSCIISGGCALSTKEPEAHSQSLPLLPAVEDSSLVAQRLASERRLAIESIVASYQHDDLSGYWIQLAPAPAWRDRLILKHALCASRLGRIAVEPDAWSSPVLTLGYLPVQVGHCEILVGIAGEVGSTEDSGRVEWTRACVSREGARPGSCPEPVYDEAMDFPLGHDFILTELAEGGRRSGFAWNARNHRTQGRLAGALLPRPRAGEWIEIRDRCAHDGDPWQSPTLALWVSEVTFMDPRADYVFSGEIAIDTAYRDCGLAFIARNHERAQLLGTLCETKECQAWAADSNF